MTGDAQFGGGPGTTSFTVAQAGFAEVGSLDVGAEFSVSGDGGGTSTALVEGAGSRLISGGNLAVGQSHVAPEGRYLGDSGSLEVTSGAQVLQDSGSQDVIGSSGPESGSISVAGAGSILNTGVASLIVGDDAPGMVTISSGGDIITSTSSGAAVTVGNFFRGSVTITGPGSNWTANGRHADDLVGRRCFDNCAIR